MINDGGDYYVKVEANQPGWMSAIEAEFMPGFSSLQRTKRHLHLTQDKPHNQGYGRIETRHIPASSRLAGLLDWPGLQHVYRVERARKIGDMTNVDIRMALKFACNPTRIRVGKAGMLGSSQSRYFYYRFAGSQFA